DRGTESLRPDSRAADRAVLEGGVLALAGLRLTRPNDVRRRRASSGSGRARRASRRFPGAERQGWRCFERAFADGGPDRSSARRAEAAIERPAPGRPTRMAWFARETLKTAATLFIFALAVLAALVIWDFYVTAPWTRDGTVRVQVASIAPLVSG